MSWVAWAVGITIATVAIVKFRRAIRVFLFPVHYGVITRVDSKDVYDEFMVWRDTVTGNGPDGDLKEPVLWVADDDAEPGKCIRARLPVFDLGEILLLNSYDREIAGHGRKPSKWFVQCEHFYTLRGARKRLKQLEEQVYEEQRNKIDQEIAEGVRCEH